jgi:uncharacterized coiled-coil protein SlyX
MAITYNKHKITKDRSVMPMSPRDRQLKQAMALNSASSDQSELIASLRAQIELLTKQLESSKDLVAENVNKELSSAIKEETANMKAKYELEVAGLSEEIKGLKELLKSKDETIALLKSGISSTGDVRFSDGPAMEEVFIDPIDKESVLEKHIVVKEVSGRAKDKLNEQKNKLRNILGGKLPK